MLILRKSELNQWKMDLSEGTLENPRFGMIQLVDVCDGNKRLYQQPIWSETRGEVDVIVNDTGEIAFVEQERHAVIPPKLYENIWGAAPDRLSIKGGIIELELPRGFANVIMAEVEEETRYKGGEVLYTTHINPNTSLFATSPFLVVSLATKIPATAPSDPNEKIRRVVWLSPEETREVETLCAFTHAGLRIFRLWALKQDNSFWQDIGGRM